MEKRLLPGRAPGRTLVAVADSNGVAAPEAAPVERTRRTAAHARTHVVTRSELFNATLLRTRFSEHLHRPDGPSAARPVLRSNFDADRDNPCSGAKDFCQVVSVRSWR